MGFQLEFSSGASEGRHRMIPMLCSLRLGEQVPEDDGRRPDDGSSGDSDEKKGRGAEWWRACARRHQATPCGSMTGRQPPANPACYRPAGHALHTPCACCECWVPDVGVEVDADGCKYFRYVSGNGVEFRSAS